MLLFVTRRKLCLITTTEPNRTYHQPLTPLNQTNIILNAKFGILSVMVRACISCKGIEDLVVIDVRMDATQYSNIYGPIYIILCLD